VPVFIFVFVVTTLFLKGCSNESNAGSSIKNEIESVSQNIDLDVFSWSDIEIRDKMNNIYSQIQVLKTKSNNSSITRDRYFYYSNLLGMELQILQHADYVNDR